MVKTTPWDSADYLITDQDIIEYLLAAIDEGDMELVRFAAAQARAAIKRHRPHPSEGQSGSEKG